MSMTQATFRTGSPLFVILTSAVTAMAAACLLLVDDPLEGIRLVIRATARASMVLFLCMFLAAPLARLWPGQLTSWLQANRRWFGLAFAYSHFVHALAILALLQRDATLFWALTNPTAIVFGSGAYMIIALLVATSFSRLMTAIGPTVWAWLHTYGTWYLWAVFLFSNAKRLPYGISYAFPVAVLLLASAIRLTARWRQDGRHVKTCREG